MDLRRAWDSLCRIFQTWEGGVVSKLAWVRRQMHVYYEKKNIVISLLALLKPHIRCVVPYCQVVVELWLIDGCSLLVTQPHLVVSQPHDMLRKPRQQHPLPYKSTELPPPTLKKFLTNACKTVYFIHSSELQAKLANSNQHVGREPANFLYETVYWQSALKYPFPKSKRGRTSAWIHIVRTCICHTCSIY